jgi:dTDP-4-amino-4,6-dideoxygalactose transaminase
MVSTLISVGGRAATAARNVPFLDLDRVHAGLKEDFLGAFARLIDSGQFTNGPEVAQFEGEFARYCDTEQCVGVASGLDGLRLALLGLGVGAGHEVVVPALTFAATAEAVTQVGATPVFADVRDGDFGLNAAGVAAAITGNTRAIIPVHLYGQIGDIRPLEEVASRQGVAIIEDACQAHGARRDGRSAGSIGVAGVFSFYPSKNLGAMGDAGAVVTDDPNLAAKLRALREHGQLRKYEHEHEGYTARLDTLQAIVLLLKLAYLDEWNSARAEAAAWYSSALANVGDLHLPTIAAQSEPAWHLYVVRTADPEGLARFLRERGIGTGRHYPQPLHLAPAYERLGYESGALPVSEAVAAQALSLPLFPGITQEELARVVGAIREYFDGG